MENGREFGEGKIHVFTNYIYWLAQINIYFVLGNIVFLFFIFTLEPVFSNIIIYFIALIPSGPAISALCYSIGKLVREKEVSPTKDFFYGYKLNFKDTLKLWLPMLLVIFILVVDLQYFYAEATVVNQILAIVFLVALIFMLGLALYIFPINVTYKFRTRDIFKLSIYYSFKKKKITFGNIGILIITLFLMHVISDFLLLLISSLVCFAFMLNNQEVMEDIKVNYVDPKQRGDVLDD
jgi:uncharacterized membrane protein YesL